MKHRDTSASNHVKCTKAKIISGRILTKNLQGTRVRAPHELGCVFRAKSGFVLFPKIGSGHNMSHAPLPY